MTVEPTKKITRHGYDREAEMEYYSEAQVCPECRNSASDEIPVTVVVDNAGLVKMKYLCLKCGCEWEVEPYHEERKVEA